MFNRRTLAQASQTRAFAPTAGQIEAAAAWAAWVKSPRFASEKESALEASFKEQILQKVLGYRPQRGEGEYTVASQMRIGEGRVDLAIGRFSAEEKRILAPFELKGPSVADLDSLPSRRGESPVQQAWRYASAAPGAKWVIVSNLRELRLYAFGHGLDAYERWDLGRLDEPQELERLWLLLGAETLLGGATADLLEQSRVHDREITDELYREYRGLRDDLIVTLEAQNPHLGRLEAIGHAQKLLDRTLFAAFAAKTGLLPMQVLETAATARNPFSPQPLWENFKGLFLYIDRGHEPLGIPAYNGGLFAQDEAFDRLAVPDGICERLNALGRFDYQSEISVLVLGHIFEQSVSDIEALQAEARGEAPPAAGRRKREGVVYTPEFVTRFIVERTIGRALSDRFARLLAEHGGRQDMKDGEAVLIFRSSKAERRFWLAWADALRTFTVLDPACGSGAFLVAAFDHLAAEYKKVNDRLADLEGNGGGRHAGNLLDLDREILTRNLFGVDVSAEAVEITKLSLWLKTAKYGKRLESLETNIRVGNSLIEDSDYHYRAFRWRDAFPEIFARSGFDAVIGNPPYVRMELIKPFKPYLEKRYRVVSDRADLYAYFYELGLRLLKPGGRLGYISSSTFFRTGSGENLRRLLAEETEVEEVVDFGDNQIFAGVTTYPAILVTRKLEEGTKPQGALHYLKLQESAPVERDDLRRVFNETALTMPRARLGPGSWQLEDDALAALRAKIRNGRRTLGEVFGPPLYGIKTGLNEAFVIDRATRERLIARDPRSADLLVPFLRGENIKRWRIESEDLWLINIPKGKVRIEDYPAIRDHLLPFKERLENRATKQKWFELQQAQAAYQPRFASRKISYPHFAEEPSFTLDTSGFFSNDKSYFIPDADEHLLALLNSKALWFVLTGLSPSVRGGWFEQRVHYIQALPIPECTAAAREALGRLAKSALASAESKLRLQTDVRHRLLDLCPSGRAPKLTKRLQNWWMLDFKTVRAEIRKAFKADIPVADRDGWEAYLRRHGDEIRRLTAEIEAAEREIDRIVYALFALTPAEIALLETTLAGPASAA